MPSRFRIRTRRRKGLQVLQLQGELDGSTACHVLDFLARTPPDAHELVLDLSGLTAVEPFGLAVLSRGLRQLGRERRMRILTSSPKFLPVLTSLAESLLVDATPSVRPPPEVRPRAAG